MSNDYNNPYTPQNNYDNFDGNNRYNRKPRGMMDKIFGSGLAQKMRSPMLGTGALLLVGAAIAGIIIVSYPSSDIEEENVPIIQASAEAYKSAPDDPGGMDIPYRDSTVFSAMRYDENGNPMAREGGRIENLLEPASGSSDTTNDTGETATFAEEPEADPEILAAAEKMRAAQNEALQNLDTSNKARDMLQQNNSVDENDANENIDVTEKLDLSASSEETLTPAEPMANELDALNKNTRDLVDVKQAAKPADTKPQSLHKAGSSPETIEFVKSVLDKKDSGTAASVEPAAGAASSSVAMTSGSYYVQVGSVRSASGASGEWQKIKKEHGALSAADYRVERADLGERGTFFRIQAGPMSKDSADSVCTSIKAKKPGGCLVVR